MANMSNLVQALESAYRKIQQWTLDQADTVGRLGRVCLPRRIQRCMENDLNVPITSLNPLPNVTITVSSTGKRRLNGHFAWDRWNQEDGSVQPEINITGQRLCDGAEAVFCTLLHEAAHALAAVNHIKDTAGRRHNQKFHDLAEVLGCEVDRTQHSAGITPAIMEWTRIIYAEEIAAIETALTQDVTRRGTVPAGRSYNYVPLTCECGERIRMAPSKYETESILCLKCNYTFETVHIGSTYIGAYERSSTQTDQYHTRNTVLRARVGELESEVDARRVTISELRRMVASLEHDARHNDAQGFGIAGRRFDKESATGFLLACTLDDVLVPWLQQFDPSARAAQAIGDTFHGLYQRMCADGLARGLRALAYPRIRAQDENQGSKLEIDPDWMYADRSRVSALELLIDRAYRAQDATLEAQLRSERAVIVRRLNPAPLVQPVLVVVPSKLDFDDAPTPREQFMERHGQRAADSATGAQ